jgi:hypothetical protein
LLTFAAMANPVLLDNITHKDLRVRLKYGASFGDNVGTVLAMPTEFADLQREYPIFFRRDTSGDYYAVALLGFDKDENLYLDGDRWDAFYLPGMVARGPFMIGFQERQEGSEVQRQPVIHVDMDHPRISETEGERVFLDQGGHSPYLQRITRVLNGLNEGFAVAKPMYAAFVALGLIVPVQLVKITGREPVNLLGFHTIDREKLGKLGPEDLLKLHRTGFLQGAYLVLASHANLEILIDRKVRKTAQAAA